MGNAEDRSSVLIVEDNPEAREILCEIMRDDGFEVREANNGREGLESAKADPPDAIILDVHMPEMDGYETCRQIKKDPALNRVPVIFCSALGDTFNKLQAFEAGGVDYVTKPFDTREIVARVNCHLLIHKYGPGGAPIPEGDDDE